MRKPDYENNLLQVLWGKKPRRATLFELYLNEEIYQKLAGHGWDGETQLSYMKMVVDAMAAGGYDYAPIVIPGFTFPQKARAHAATVSLNGSGMIGDRESFDAYVWPDADKADYGILDQLAAYMPEGLKLCVEGPCGVLENTIAIVGYDNLCFMIHDDPDLVKDITDRVGSCLVQYYRNAAKHPAVGFICSNDDWGFNTQTFLSPKDMRKYIFPWHKKIAAIAHEAGKPCMLHSCGEFREVLEDMIGDIRFDARHSYEDNIIPVEEAYELLTGRIAVMGGMDMNLMTKGTPQEIYDRASAMLARTKDRGGYALGSGNSIAPYIPVENFMALIRAAADTDEQ